MKTMIANAEKLEKLGELIEVEGTNVAFGGNVELDGNVNKSDNSIVLTLNGQAKTTFNKSFLKNNTLYAISFEDGTSTTMFYKEDADSSSSALTYVFSDDVSIFVNVTAVNTNELQLQVFKNDGSIADTMGNYKIELAPVITYI